MSARTNVAVSQRPFDPKVLPLVHSNGQFSFRPLATIYFVRYKVSDQARNTYMEFKESYSLADVVRVSRGKRRSVQLWAESGAIQAYSATDRRGTGTHRQFSRDETIIACCLNVLAKRQVGIGELIRIGRGIRYFLNRGKFRKLVEDVISAEGWEESWNYFLVIIWTEHRDPYVLLLEESELSPELGNRLKGAGLSVIIPLRKAFENLRISTKAK
jgi:hypothetical protein